MKTVEKILKYKLLPLFDSEEEMNESMGNKYNEIIEAMQIYADQQSAIAVAKRDKEIRDLNSELQGIANTFLCFDHLSEYEKGQLEIIQLVQNRIIQFLSTPTSAGIAQVGVERIRLDLSILKQAIYKWGMDAQCEMIIEECLELGLALQKFKRSGNKDQKYANIIDEIADVTIMITQAHQMFPRDRIQERIDFKINRLTERLKDELYDNKSFPKPSRKE